MHLRCFECNVYQLIRDFLRFIEREVIFTDRRFLIDTTSQATAKPEETGKFLTELLMKMNFKIDRAEYFDRSFYKEEVRLVFSKLPGYDIKLPTTEQGSRTSAPTQAEDYALIISPDITSLCSDLQEKLKTLYITFICIPICISKNYFYIGSDLDDGWKDLLHFYENKNL